MSNPSEELFKEEPHWEEPTGGALHHVETRAESPGSSRSDAERRHSSSASTSTRSTGNLDGNGPRGRRTRPSITSASASLATVKERDQNRAESFRALSSLSAPSVMAIDENRPLSSPGMSSISSGRPPTVAKLGSEEIVVSSKKVGKAGLLLYIARCWY
jgi:hypothetical protein